MDYASNFMDFIIKHQAAFPRRFKAPCPVQTVGFIAKKDHWVRQVFKTFNFSLILRGRGEFHFQGKSWDVESPCVITQWPGDPVQYGPPVPKETWDEIFLIYDAHCVPHFRERGFIRDDRPVWPIHNMHEVLPIVEDLRALTHHLHPEQMTDRVDCVCERLVLETLLPAPVERDNGLHDLAVQLQNFPEKVYDFDQLAREYGMSPSTFRRRWFDLFHLSPGRHLLNLRIQKARRMLAETTTPVGTVAEKSGFEDMFYFSRRFKIETKLTPSEYRRRYRI